MPKPVIEYLQVGEYQVLTYLLACPETKAGALIDPAGEEERLAAWVREQGVELKYILNTHAHPDHTLGNARIKEIFGVPVAFHRADDEFFASPEGREVAAGELGLSPPEPADIRLEDGNIIDLGKLRIEVLHTPGHSPGSVCFLVEGHLFTGDTLFVGAAGRTDLGGASLETMLESIEKRILTLPDETIIHPGHDYGDTPSSTLGREREENIYITDFILEG